jgi:hypothetical protein
VFPSGYETTVSAEGSTISWKRQTPDEVAPAPPPRRSVNLAISSAAEIAGRRWRTSSNPWHTGQRAWGLVSTTSFPQLMHACQLAGRSV